MVKNETSLNLNLDLDGLKEVSLTLSNIQTSLNNVGEASDKLSEKKISFGGSFEIIMSVLSTLVEYFMKLMSTNDEFAAKVDKVWGKVTEAFEPVVEVVLQLFDSFISGSDGAGGALDSFIEIISGVAEFIAEILTSVGEFFSEHGESIMNIIMEIWEFIFGIVEGAVDIISGIIDIIVGLFTGNGDLIAEGIVSLWEGICGIFSAGLEFVGTLFSTIWEVICGIFAGVGEFFGNVFKAGWNAVKTAFSGIGKFFSNIWKNITKVFAKVGSWFGDKFKAAWNGVKKAFSGCVKFFSNIWTNIKKLFSKVGTAIGDGISGAFKAVVNGVISFASTIINGFIGAINGAIRLINKIPGVDIPVIARVSLPRLATGGIVNAGQMFIAREAGPELVGTMGSRTAVMNNNQIVESVSRGVYDAVASALGSGGIGGDWTIQIVDENGSVKAEDIITAIERRNRRDGKTVIALGV